MSKSKQLRSYFWSFANSGGSQIIGFLSTMLIARVASPTDFGLIAICSSIVLVSTILSEAGLASTVIVNKDFSVEKSSTILVVVSGASILIFCMVVAFTSELAEFVEQNRVAEILPVMALTILANGFRCVHSAVLQRRLQFKKLSVIYLVCVSVGSSIGVLVAYLHEPLIGLVTVFVLSPIMSTAALWIFAPWGFYFYCKPKLLYSDIGFTLNVTLSSFLDQATKAVLVFFLNNRFGVSDLGLYSRAEAIKNLSTQTLDKVIQRVSFPILSRKNHESLDNAIDGYIRISATLSSILIPLMYLFFNYAESIILILYGPNWGESEPILKKIVFIGFFAALTSQNSTVFKALGRPKIMSYNKSLGLFTLPLVFTLMDSSQMLEVLDGLIVYSVVLYGVSVMCLLSLGTVHLVRYVKYVFGASFLSLAIIFIHCLMLDIPVRNVLLNLAVNGISLLILIALVYYGIYFLIKGMRDGKA